MDQYVRDKISVTCQLLCDSKVHLKCNYLKGTVMQIEKALINDRSRVSKVS